MLDITTIISHLFDLLISFSENFLLLLLIEIFLPKKSNMTIAFACILTIISTVVNQIFYPPLFSSFILLILLYVYTFINLDGNKKTKILIPLLVFSNLFVINTFINFIFILLNIEPKIFISNLTLEYFIITVFQKLILFFEYLFIKKYKTHQIYFSNITWAFCTLLIIISISFPIIIFTEYLLKNITQIYIIIISMINFFVINILIYILLLKMNIDHHKILEQNILIESQKREQKIIDFIDQKIAEMNKLNHDFNNHKLVIKKMIENHENTQILEYVNNIFPDSNQSYISSSNPVLNYILEEKIKIAKEKNIDVKCMIQGDLNHTISSVDLSIIIGNLLDNAIEATSKCFNKHININIRQNNYQLVIKISNPYNGIIKIKNQKLQTTKSDKTNHGYGIDNIETICKKYNGFNHISYDNQTFTHTCILSLQ